MKNERDVKNAVKKVLAKYGDQIWYFMPVQSGFGTHGVPDFVCCVGGVFLTIETKYGGNDLSEWQKRQIDSIQKASGAHLTVWENTVDRVDDMVLALLACNAPMGGAPGA